MPTLQKAAAAIAIDQATKRQADPTVTYLLGELTNELTTAQVAIDDMVRLANDLDFPMTLEIANAILVRKTIVAEHVLATVEKALRRRAAPASIARSDLSDCCGTPTVHSSIRCRANASTASPAALPWVSIQSQTQLNGVSNNSGQKALTSEEGHQRRFGGESVLSVVPPISDIRHRNGDVQKSEQLCTDTALGATRLAARQAGLLAQEAAHKTRMCRISRSE